jgi:hypothetical protein
VPTTAKSLSTKGTGYQSGDCVRKLVVLTSGDLPFVVESRLRMEVIGRQKSAEGVVCVERPGGANRRRSATGENHQQPLACKEETRREGTSGLGEEIATLAAERTVESPAIAEQSIEEICERENCKPALKQGQRGQTGSGWEERPGAAGIPGCALGSNPRTFLPNTAFSGSGGGAEGEVRQAVAMDWEKLLDTG